MDMDILFCHVQLMKTMVMIRMPGIWKGGDGVNDHEENGDNDESDDEDDKDEDVSTCAMLIWLSGLTCVTPILSKLAPTLSSNHLAVTSVQ